MQKYIQLIVIFTASMVLLSGCGGGGGGGGESASSSTTAPQKSTTVNNEEKREISSATDILPTNVPRIVDASGVYGLKVLCGSKRITTGQGGTFSCDKLPVSIFLGEEEIGKISMIPADKRIYTQDILGKARAAIMDPLVTKLSMVLQSLDSDGNPSNGIVLLSKNIDVFNRYLLSTGTLATISFDDLENVLQDTISDIKIDDPHTRVHFVDAKSAQYNLATEMANAPSLTYAQRLAGE